MVRMHQGSVLSSFIFAVVVNVVTEFSKRLYLVIFGMLVILSW